MQFKKISLDEIDAVYAINYSLQKELAWTKEQLLTSLESKSCNLCLFDNSELIGFVICPYVCDEAEIHLIGIAEQYQNKGRASLLLKHLFTELQLLNISKIHLEVRASNVPAIHLYNKSGFEQIAVRKKYYKTLTDKREDALVFMKLLS